MEIYAPTQRAIVFILFTSSLFSMFSFTPKDTHNPNLKQVRATQHTLACGLSPAPLPGQVRLREEDPNGGGDPGERAAWEKAWRTKPGAQGSTQGVRLAAARKAPCCGIPSQHLPRRSDLSLLCQILSPN